MIIKILGKLGCFADTLYAHAGQPLMLLWCSYICGIVYLCYVIFVLVFFHKERILSFGEDFNALRKTVGHCRNLVGGKVRLSPNWFLERIMLLKVAVIGRSSHWRRYLDTRLSRFSTTNVFERSATVRFQDILERTKL